MRSILTGTILLGCVSVASALTLKRFPDHYKTPGVLSTPRERPASGKLSAFVIPSIQLRSSKNAGVCRRLAARQSGVLSAHCSTLVTYGDIWRNTVEELPTVPGDNQVNLTIDNKFIPEHEGVSITGIAGMSADFEEIDRRNGSSLQAVVRPVKKAATVMGAVAAGAAANIWESLTKGPSEDEVKPVECCCSSFSCLHTVLDLVRRSRYHAYSFDPQAQENLRKWAKAKGGAVLPPMEEDELDNEVILAPAINHPPMILLIDSIAICVGSLRWAVSGAGGADDGDHTRRGGGGRGAEPRRRCYRLIDDAVSSPLDAASRVLILTLRRPFPPSSGRQDGPNLSLYLTPPSPTFRTVPSPRLPQRNNETKIAVGSCEVRVVSQVLMGAIQCPGSGRKRPVPAWV